MTAPRPAWLSGAQRLRGTEAQRRTAGRRRGGSAALTGESAPLRARGEPAHPEAAAHNQGATTSEAHERVDGDGDEQQRDVRDREVEQPHRVEPRADDTGPRP